MTDATDDPATRTPTLDEQAVAAANDALYAAFERADVDAMAALWDDGDAVSCVHPGWPPLRGRRQVLRSWTAMMASASITFIVSDVHVEVEGDTAVVTCVEDVLSGDAGTAVATNVFRRRPGGWRLQVHHASPLMSADR